MNVDCENCFINSIRCSAHTLQLVVHGGLEALKSDARAEGALLKVKKIAKFGAKRSNFAYSLSGHVFPQTTPTRWNSEFRLLQYILQNADLLNQALNLEKKAKRLALTQVEIEVLFALMDLLSFF